MTIFISSFFQMGILIFTIKQNALWLFWGGGLFKLPVNYELWIASNDIGKFLG